MLFYSKVWFCLATLIVDPTVGVFDVITLDAEGGGIGVGEGEGAGVGHVVSPCIVVCGGQFQFELQSYKESSVMVFSKV